MKHTYHLEKFEALKILAIVPSAFCFGLQNLTLDFFSVLRGKVNAHFLNTAWNDGEFQRRVAGLGYSHSLTWFGMFSRKLDLYNLRMSISALWKLPIAWCDFIKLVWRFRPDVIYLANHHEVILLWPLLIFFRKRVVVHMHDPSPSIPFQRFSFFFWRRAVGKFIFISRSVQARTSRLGPSGRWDEVIHNGVRISALARPRQRQKVFINKFQWPDDVLIIGMSGQMTATKGHEDFIDAAARVVDIIPHSRFVIGGKACDPYSTVLKQKIADLGLSGHFGWSGWMDSAQEFYEGLDIFVLASRHDEGFGLVVAEAMERGCAVIATRSGGAVEIVEDGVSGMLINKRDPSDLARALVTLAGNADFRSRISEAARERICEHFDIDRQADQFLKALSSKDMTGNRAPTAISHSNS